MSKHFDELERAVHALAERYQRSVAERNDLQKLLTARDEKISALKVEISRLTANKEAVGQRIDDLIEQIDRLDEQLQASEN